MTRKTGNRPGGRWLANADYDAPEFNLLAAVVHKAVRDAQRGLPADRADALAYFTSTNFEIDCAILNLNPQRVLDLMQRAGEPEPEPPDATHLTDDHIRAIHTRYQRERNISLRALARQYSTTAATLSRRFARLNLTTRGRGPNITLAPRPRAKQPEKHP